MNRYETIFILESDIPDAEREPMIEKIKALIPQHDGVMILMDDWGNRKLAYPIKKKKMTEEDLDRLIQGKLVTTTSLDDLKDVDLVIEAVLEDMKVKVLADFFQAIAPSADGLADCIVAVAALEQLGQGAPHGFGISSGGGHDSSASSSGPARFRLSATNITIATSANANHCTA